MVTITLTDQERRTVVVVYSPGGQPFGFVGGRDKRRGEFAGLTGDQFFTVDTDLPLDGAVVVLDADDLDPDVVDIPDRAVEAAQEAAGAFVFEVVEESGADRCGQVTEHGGVAQV